MHKQIIMRIQGRTLILSIYGKNVSCGKQQGNIYFTFNSNIESNTLIIRIRHLPNNILIFTLIHHIGTCSILLDYTRSIWVCTRTVTLLAKIV